MKLFRFASWLRPRLQGRRAASKSSFRRLIIEPLEDRTVPSLTVGPNVDISQLSGNEAESTISINPNNVQNLFASDTFAGFCRYSTNGGTTWTNSNMSALPGTIGDVQTAWDSYGNLFITRFGTSQSVVVGRSIDGGATFSLVGTMATGTDQPSIAVGANSVWVSYTTSGGQINAAGASVTGLGTMGSFGTPQATVGPAGDFGDIAIGPSGQVMVVYQNSGSGNGPDTIHANLDSDGLGGSGFASFTSPTTTNVGGFDAIPPQPSRTIDAEANLAWDRTGGAHNGRVYLVYVDETPNESNNTDIYVRYSDNNGTTWSTAVKVNDDTGTNSQLQPAIALDQTTGNVAVTWYDARNAGAADVTVQFGAVSTDGGATFSANVQISTGTTNATVAAVGSFNLGDYDKMDYANGVFYRSWADNSNSTGNNPNGTLNALDIYTAKVTVSGFTVVSSNPAVGSTVASSPANYVITFSNAVDPNSLQPTDFQVDGNNATDVSLSADHLTATFTFTSDPAATQGLHTMTIAAGAITQEGNLTSTIGAFSGPFHYDALPMQVTSTNPASGSVVNPPMTSLDVNLNEPVLPSSVSTSDLTLSIGSVTGFTLTNSNQTIHFTLSGLTAEGNLTASIAAGALSDAYGNPNPTAFSGTYALDFGTTAFPTPLTALNPLGSLVYDPTASALINFAGDTDSFTLGVDPGQTITVVVTAGAGLQPTVTLVDPASSNLGNASAAGVGQNALLQTIPTTTGGTYTITVGGVGSTSVVYTVQVTLNAAREAESVLSGVSNDTRATAQNIDPSFLALQPSAAPSRGAVVGGNADASVAAFSTSDFESGQQGYTATGLWHLSTRRGTEAGHSPTHSFYYGSETTGTYNTGATNAGTITSSSIAMPSTGPLTLTFNYVLLTEGTNSTYDLATVLVSTNNFATSTTIASSASSSQLPQESAWHAASFSLSAFAGQTIQIRFSFNTVDSAFNDFEGWYVDDVQLSSPGTWTDYYSFSAAANDTVSIAQKNLTGTVTNVFVENSAGTVLATGATGATNYNHGISNLTLASAGTYYVRVTGATAATYDVVLTRNAAFDTEGNNTAATAQAMAGNTGALGAIATTADADWYAVTLGAAQGALQATTSTPADGPNEFVNVLNPKLELYDSTGSTLLFSGTALADGRNESLSATGLTPGATYMIRISGESSTTGEYTVVIASQTAPSVTGLNPTSGPAAGGTSVVITGAGFAGATAVLFGGANAASYSVDSDTQITATDPAGSGVVDVTVVTPVGTSGTSSADLFTYVAAPMVTFINPNTGPATGGTNIIIIGSNFTGATAVKFGANNATTFTVTTPTHITATSPAGAGIVDVTVTTPGGTSATSGSDLFTYVSTTTTSLTDNGPNPSNSGDAVSFTATVSGGPPISGQSVTIEDASNANAVVASPTLAAGAVTFTISTLSVGTHNLFAVYGGDSTHTSSNSSATPVTQVVNTAPAPAVSSVVVNGGAPQYTDSQGFSINLAGQNSVVEQILVTFNEPVTLDPGAFSVTNNAAGVTVNSGAQPNTEAVTVNDPIPVGGGPAATQWIATFSGPGTTALAFGGSGNVIKDGLYIFNTDGSKVHANAQTAATNNTGFWAMYAAVHDNILSPTIGDGNSEVFLDVNDFNEFAAAFNSGADSSLPAYDVAMDYDLDGFYDADTFNAFVASFNSSKDWSF